MKLFNAFQITAAFVAWPFLISWLDTAQFRGATAAFWSSAVFYVVGFFAMVGSVYNSIDK